MQESSRPELSPDGESQQEGPAAGAAPGGSGPAEKGPASDSGAGRSQDGSGSGQSSQREQGAGSEGGASAGPSITQRLRHAYQVVRDEVVAAVMPEPGAPFLSLRRVRPRSTAILAFRCHFGQTRFMGTAPRACAWKAGSAACLEAALHQQRAMQLVGGAACTGFTETSAMQVVPSISDIGNATFVPYLAAVHRNEPWTLCQTGSDEQVDECTLDGWN
jgi:hypothetical protein